jgi:hypothetical protein
MMKKRLSPEALKRWLRERQQEYGRIKARIQDVGFICEGSLVQRWMPCGKSNCRCSTNPKQRHGPYWQLSWKEAGRTVSRRLSPEHARLYRQWIANRRALESLLRQMRAVSRKAGQHLLAAAVESIPDRGRPRPPRGSEKRRRA